MNVPFPVSCWVKQAQNLSIRILFQNISWLVNAGGLIGYQCAEGWGNMISNIQSL